MGRRGACRAYEPRLERRAVPLIGVRAFTLVGALLLASGCTGSPDVVAYDARAGTAGTTGSAGSGGTPPGGGAPGDGGEPPLGEPQMLPLSGDLDVNDPTIIEEDGRLYLFHTGAGISAKVSDDLLVWRSAPRVFEANPAWIAELVPNARGLWSPDIAFFGGEYHLYYAASSFGEGRSCIGHATKARLADPEPWLDRGSVVCSDVSSRDDPWNAIDPSVVLDADGDPWLAFGSFRSGIQLVALDASGAGTLGEPAALAARPDDDGAVQAASLVQHEDHYYLFVSFDYCCRGIESTHRIMVGRAAQIGGPYLDRAERPMLEGGGSPLVEGNERWSGPGSNALLFRDGRAYNVYHAYDVNGRGDSMLRIAEVIWDAEQWPVSAGP